MTENGESGQAGLNRRSFLSGVTAGGVIAGALPLLGAAQAQAQQAPRGPGRGPRRSADRAQAAFSQRYEAAAAHLRDSPRQPQPGNGDEQRYADLRASFCKTLPQNEFGEVDPAVFADLRRALAAGTKDAMAAVPLSPDADRGLANPLAAHAFEMLGPDSWGMRMAPAPTFDSPEQAAEMAEVYWQALTRDVPFRDYAGDPTIGAAIEDLNGFQHVVGEGDEVRLTNLFRGETPRQEVGPYLSQLLWLPAQWGLVQLSQRFSVPLPGHDFGRDLGEWLEIQRGVAPSAATAFDTTARHIATGRDLAEFVHNDVSYQAYLTAALVMLGMGDDAIDPSNPYLDSGNQEGFVTFGVAEVADLVAKAANLGLKAAWYQKWLAHRRLRPEVFAARAELQASGARDYDVHSDLFESEAAARLQSEGGSLLLPLAFPEGSPTHPSYPAGHAVVAGSCATVLKALFHEAYEVPGPVEASFDGSRLDAWTGAPLTLGGEIEKLASNIALGRDAAGVHYRSDGIDGLQLGEQVALGLLADYAGTRAERFGGFSLTRFDGSRVRVGGDGVTQVPSGAPRKRRRSGRRETA